MTLSPGHLSIIILIHWSKVKKSELFFQEAQLFWVRSSSGAKALRPCRSDQTDQLIPQMFQLMCSRYSPNIWADDGVGRGGLQSSKKWMSFIIVLSDHQLWPVSQFTYNTLRDVSFYVSYWNITWNIIRDTQNTSGDILSLTYGYLLLTSQNNRRVSPDVTECMFWCQLERHLQKQVESDTASDSVVRSDVQKDWSFNINRVSEYLMFLGWRGIGETAGTH